MSPKNWYVVHTQPHREAVAESNLRRQGFVTYLPRYFRQIRHARKTESVARPLFPRYLFIALDLTQDRWYSIRSTFGVSNIVVASDQPAPVPDGVVDEIQAREDQNGFVAIGLPAGLRAGSAVRLVDGIFAESRGVLERIADERRVSILLNLLGRQVRVSVPAAAVGSV